LLSSKVSLICFCAAFIFLSTGCKKSNEPPPHQHFENPQLVLKTAKDLIGENISFTSAGHFESDSLKSIVAGVEINEKNSWGIKFHLISWVEGEFKLRYSTTLLEGSFIQCLVDKIKFSDIETELIYYNSKNYFLGNAGGEIYSHIIDLKKLRTYSAHLSVISSGRVSLDLSENIDNAMIKNFFVSYFRKDYPNLRLIERAL
jgi:subtilase family serine protease